VHIFFGILQIDEGPTPNFGQLWGLFLDHLPSRSCFLQKTILPILPNQKNRKSKGCFDRNLIGLAEHVIEIRRALDIAASCLL
jgi:hypothetical protein